MNVTRIGKGMVCANVNFCARKRDDDKIFDSELPKKELPIVNQKIAAALLAAASMWGSTAECNNALAQQPVNVDKIEKISTDESQNQSLIEVIDVADAKQPKIDLRNLYFRNDFISIYPNYAVEPSMEYKWMLYNGDARSRYIEEYKPYNGEILGNDPNCLVGTLFWKDIRISPKAAYAEPDKTEQGVTPRAIWLENGPEIAARATYQNSTPEEKKELAKIALALLPYSTQKNTPNARFYRELAEKLAYGKYIEESDVPSCIVNTGGLSDEQIAALRRSGYYPTSNFVLAHNMKAEQFTTVSLKATETTATEARQIESLQNALETFSPEDADKNAEIAVIDSKFGHNFYDDESNIIYMSRETLKKGFASSFASLIHLLNPNESINIANRILGDKAELAKFRSIGREQFGDDSITLLDTESFDSQVEAKIPEIEKAVAKRLIRIKLPHTKYNLDDLAAYVAKKGMRVDDKIIRSREEELRAEYKRKYPKFPDKDIQDMVKNNVELQELKEFSAAPESVSTLMSNRMEQIKKEHPTWDDKTIEAFYAYILEQRLRKNKDVGECLLLTMVEFMRDSVYPDNITYGVGFRFNPDGPTPQSILPLSFTTNYISLFEQTTEKIAKRITPDFPDHSEASAKIMSNANEGLYNSLCDNESAIKLMAFYRYYGRLCQKTLFVQNELERINNGKELEKAKEVIAKQNIKNAEQQRLERLKNIRIN